MTKIFTETKFLHVFERFIHITIIHLIGFYTAFHGREQ